LLLLVIFVYLISILIPRPASVNLNSSIPTSFEIDVSASVYKVIDGDTFDAFPVGRVRLADINAPESGEPGYNEAKQALTNLVLGKTVYLDVDDIYVMDKYNRLVCVAYLKYNSTHLMNINFYLVINGYAVIEDYSNEFDPSTWKLYVYGPIMINIRTDKTRYFQGNLVNIIGKAVSDKEPVAGVYINIKVNKLDGTLIFMDQVKTDNDGNFSTNFRLPLDAPLGTYNITATYGNSQAVCQFEVISAKMIYTLSDFPRPFSSLEEDISNTYILIPISDPHGPCGPAHTMDTMGAALIGTVLGRKSNSGMVKVAMDTYSYISTYDYATAKVTMIDTTSNMITLGSPGVNQIAYYVNELTDDKGNRVAPVLFLRFPNDTDYLYVQSSSKIYKLRFGSSGRLVDDYGVVEIVKDRERYILCAYGLSGESTKAAAIVVANYEKWNLYGKAVIVRYYDSDGDEWLDTITIVEYVP
jgi:hypothetical protein